MSERIKVLELEVVVENGELGVEGAVLWEVPLLETQAEEAEERAA